MPWSIVSVDHQRGGLLDGSELVFRNRDGRFRVTYRTLTANGRLSVTVTVAVEAALVLVNAQDPAAQPLISGADTLSARDLLRLSSIIGRFTGFAPAVVYGWFAADWRRIDEKKPE